MIMTSHLYLRAFVNRVNLSLYHLSVILIEIFFCVLHIKQKRNGGILFTECMQLTDGKYAVYRTYAADQWEVFRVRNVCS